jgi:mannitol/fructose-specific phosphotransferase system IIA component (Ntr-type)
MKSIQPDKLITPDDILFDVSVNDRFELIREISRRLDGSDGVLDPNQLAEDAINREQELATGLERGLAMPHARTNSVNRLICKVLRLKTPVSFDAPDGSLADIIIFSAVPPKGLDDYLHLVAAIVRRVSHDEVRDSLRRAKNAEELHNALFY